MSHATVVTAPETLIVAAAALAAGGIAAAPAVPATAATSLPDTPGYNLPLALGWGMYEFPRAYQQTGAASHAMDEMKWFSDYFLRSTFLNSSGQVVAFAYQVGEGSVDHDYWGPSELQSATQYPRPAYLASSETPAADQAASAAAALAVESVLTAGSDASYSAECLKYAQALYSFALQYPGIGYSGGFYNSSGYVDKEAWAAVWLYIATGEWNYINDIIATNSSGAYTGYFGNIVTSPGSTWQNTWVNKWQVQYWSHVPHDNSSDTNFIATTPAGFSYLTSWGSARYDTAAQLEALTYRKNFPNDPESAEFSNWAMGQMNYLMGDNPANWSYIVGFGSTTPFVGSEVGGGATAASHPHHGDAQGSLTNSQSDPAADNHILWGALVGGPSSTDQPDDVTTDFVLNEVAVDYDAAFVGALAGLETYYGSEVTQPTTSFTPPSFPQGDCTEYTETTSTCGQPYYATATLNQNSDQGTQLTVNINNMADEPPHLQTGMSARVYFDISSLHAAGQSSALSPPRCTTTRRTRSTVTPPRSARRSSGATRTAASTTSQSTGARTASGCRRRARSSSASTRPSARTTATTGAPQPRRS